MYITKTATNPIFILSSHPGHQELLQSDTLT
jgi:hypothetical protein